MVQILTDYSDEATLLVMARSIRVEYPGAFYHVMARGNRREAIFFDDDDRRFFLKAVGEVCARTGWRAHAWSAITWLRCQGLITLSINNKVLPHLPLDLLS
jgi:hypothetical protein